MNDDLTVEIAQIVGLEPPVEREAPAPTVDTFEPLQKYYGLDEVDSKQSDQLKTVWEYYSKDAEHEGETLKRIRDAHMRMVQPEIGQTKLSQLADYVKILRQVDNSSKQLQAYQKETNESTSKVDQP